LNDNLVKCHQFKEGDLIKVLTPDGAKFLIKLEQREGVLWFGKGWELITCCYNIDSHKHLLIIKKQIGRHEMVPFRKSLVEAE